MKSPMNRLRFALGVIVGLPFGIAPIATTISATLLLGCASAPTQPPRAPLALLIIQNQRSAEEWIYLEQDGARGRHIGTVPALATDTLVLRDGDLSPGTQFDLIAIQFPGNPAGADRSDDITAVRGVVYVWQLAPMRGNNFLSQRSAE